MRAFLLSETEPATHAVDVERIRRGLEPCEPVGIPPGAPGDRAAVAAVLHQPRGGALRLLFIERACRDGDPWSGDLAFPGGGMEPDDADERAAAERETREEVDLDLAAADFLGRLDDLAARLTPLTVAAFVYALDPDREAPALTLSVEVRHAFWAPFADLLDPGRRRIQRHGRGAAVRRYPALDLLGPGRPLLWGVTYQFVRALVELAGHQLPGPGD